MNLLYIRENYFVRNCFLSVLYTVLAFQLLSTTASCNKPIKDTVDSTVTTVSFSNIPLAYPMATMVPEASGIADSKMNPGWLWAEEDSNNPPQLYLVEHTGSSIKKVFIKGATNTDWEDIALADGPDPSKKYIYIGEIGDNDAVHPVSGFYRFEEPLAGTDTVRVFDFIRFSYADGPRDAEAFIVDNTSKDIFIITKRDNSSRVYRISYPYSLTAVNTAVFVQTFSFNGIVSAASSTDGKGIIIKTYQGLYYYDRLAGETIPQSLAKNARALAYTLEPQGEAVCFALDNSGFYTLSEKGLGGAQFLYFYKKN